ncbi:hypothetical protein JW964_08265, partial [candidate division KSB1 bacterium]|nr:hypothetical protein [candidate division KSB1 bacterium]
MRTVLKIWLLLLSIPVSGFISVQANEPAHQWQTLGPYSGDIQTISCSPLLYDLIYVGSRHGLYKSSDG